MINGDRHRSSTELGTTSPGKPQPNCNAAGRPNQTANLIPNRWMNRS